MKKNRENRRQIVPAEPDFAEVLAPGGGMADGHAAERVRAHLAASQAFGRLSLAHAIAAGWELAIQKARLGWGGWMNWCRTGIGISHKTADRYIALFAQTVGAMRGEIGIAVESPLQMSEVAEATLGMEDKTATGAMVALGIVRRNPAHGGRRNEAAEENGHRVGRPPKDAKAEAEAVAAEIEAAANAPALLWASAKGALDTLLRLDSEKDFLRRIGDDELASAAGLLAELSRKAAEILAPRLAAREGGAR